MALLKEKIKSCTQIQIQKLIWMILKTYNYLWHIRIKDAGFVKHFHPGADPITAGSEMLLFCTCLNFSLNLSLKLSWLEYHFWPCVLYGIVWNFCHGFLKKKCDIISGKGAKIHQFWWIQASLSMKWKWRNARLWGYVCFEARASVGNIALDIVIPWP